MINIYRRHGTGCGDFGKRTEWRRDRCACKFWADGTPLKETISLKTREANVAQKRLVRLEETNGEAFEDAAPIAAKDRKTLADAIAAFLDDPDFKKKSGTEWTRKFRTNLGQLAQYAKQRRKTYLDELDADFIADFRNWFTSPHADPRRGREGRMISDGERAANVKTRQMRQFFELGVKREWIPKNPTSGIEIADVKTDSKRGLTSATMEKILAQAAADIENPTENHTTLATALRVEALILLMRYSGLRISDAVALPKSAIHNGRVMFMLRKTRKHGKEISNELPEFVLDKLAEVPAESTEYFFWTGRAAKGTHDDPKHRVKDFQGKLGALCERAGLLNVTAHSFRHTFARAILASPGKTLQDVADALGDNLTTVQRHYAGKSEERTARTNEAIRSTWANDPILERMHAEKYGSHKVVAIAGKRRAS